MEFLGCYGGNHVCRLSTIAARSGVLVVRLDLPGVTRFLLQFKINVETSRLTHVLKAIANSTLTLINVHTRSLIVRLVQQLLLV